MLSIAPSEPNVEDKLHILRDRDNQWEINFWTLRHMELCRKEKVLNIEMMLLETKSHDDCFEKTNFCCSYFTFCLLLLV